MTEIETKMFKTKKKKKAEKFKIHGYDLTHIIIDEDAELEKKDGNN